MVCLNKITNIIAFWSACPWWRRWVIGICWILHRHCWFSPLACGWIGLLCCRWTCLRQGEGSTVRSFRRILGDRPDFSQNLPLISFFYRTCCAEIWISCRCSCRWTSSICRYWALAIWNVWFLLYVWHLFHSSKGLWGSILLWYP